MTPQAEFALALRQPERPPPAGLRCCNGCSPEIRFAVYRNNVVASQIAALAESFPVTLQLVGADFFRGMARVYVQTHTLNSRVLAWIGRDFPDFIRQFAPASGLAYLGDVAQLEYLRICAYHAADQASLDPQSMAQALTDPQALQRLQLHLHPSTHLLRSPHAVYSLWAAHQELLDIGTVQPEHAEAVLVFRAGLEVQLVAISSAQALCIQRLLEQQSLAFAAEEACQCDAGFDLGATLRLLVQAQLIVAMVL